LNSERFYQSVGDHFRYRLLFDLDNLLAYPRLLNIDMLELSNEFKGILDQESNRLKVIARSGKVLIDIKVNIIEESSPLEDP
jgi:hypothetical protein